MRKIFFKNSKGRDLCGYLHEPKAREGAKAKPRGKTADKAVIMCHGFTGDKSEDGMFDSIASLIFRAGFAVLRFDFSGCGESDDANITVKGEIDDARSAIELIKSRGYNRIGMLGFSLGGLVALSARDDSIKARVLLAPLTKSKDIPSGYSFWDHFVLIVTGRRKLIKPGRKWRKEMVVGRRFYFEVRDIDQKKLARDISTPTLIIHGDKDTRVPFDYSISLMKLLPKSARLEVIKGADHHFDNDIPRLVMLSAAWFSKNII